MYRASAEYAAWWSVTTISIPTFLHNMASPRQWLYDGNDIALLEGAGWVLIVLGLSMVVCDFFNLRIPYGRYGDDHKGLFAWLGLTKFKLPSKLAWFAMEMPSFIIPTFLVLNVGGKYVGEFNPNIVLLGMFILHYFNRVFLFSLCVRGKPTPLAPVLVAFLFNSTTGYMQGRYLTQFLHYDLSWFYDPRFLLGHVIFLTGMAINIHSDATLRSLRKPGDTSYKIPHGGMFMFVSGANYFGESLEWSGYALACWSWPGLVMAVFTSLFLGSRAVQHHRFYLKKFEDYPKNRKAFIPFIL